MGGCGRENSVDTSGGRGARRQAGRAETACGTGEPRCPPQQPLPAARAGARTATAAPQPRASCGAAAALPPLVPPAIPVCTPSFSPGFPRVCALSIRIRTRANACADGQSACPGEPGKNDGVQTGIMGAAARALGRSFLPPTAPAAPGKGGTPDRSLASQCFGPVARQGVKTRRAHHRRRRAACHVSLSHGKVTPRGEGPRKHSRFW